MKIILKSILQGAGIGGIAGIAVNTVDDYFGYLPKWARLTIDLLIGMGIVSVGTDLAVGSRKILGEFDSEVE